MSAGEQLEKLTPRDELIRANRQASVQRAIAIREFRKRMRREIRSGDLPAFAALRGQAEPWVRRAMKNHRVDKFLVLIPGVGEATMHEVLLALDIPPWTVFGAMTWAQRHELADVLYRATHGEPVRIPTPYDP